MISARTILSNSSSTRSTPRSTPRRAIPATVRTPSSTPKISTARSSRGASPRVKGWITSWLAKWIELGNRSLAANLSTLTTSANVTLAREIYNLVDEVNIDKAEQEKRWNLRPHKISAFTAYDFKTGRLKGFSVGGGWRWRSANVIGANSRGQEITGKEMINTDLMLRYVRKLERLPGRVTFQFNVNNVLNRTDIIPQRLSNTATAPDGFIIPGGRGVAYSRYDLVEPRDLRFTTTWSF